MALLTAALIVKNEERDLSRCLASLDGVDEIVVVDTGSTDATVAIAEEAGARVRKIPWNHDFAAARNQALDACVGDWILVIDADEVGDDLAEVVAGRDRGLVAGVAETGIGRGVAVAVDTALGAVAEEPVVALCVGKTRERTGVRKPGVRETAIVVAAMRPPAISRT